MSTDPRSSPPSKKCCACRCDECQQRHDDFINGVKNLINTFKKLTAKRGVIPKIALPEKIEKVKNAITRSLSQVKRKRKRKISSPTQSAVSILPMTDFTSSSKGDEEVVTSHSSSKANEEDVATFTSNVQKHYGPFEGYNIAGDGPTELISSFSEWIREGLCQKHAQLKDKDNHYSPEYSGVGFKQLDFVEAFPEKKDWFYLMSHPNKCWNNEYLDVILYYLRKKSKKQIDAQYRYTTTTCFFKTYIDKANDDPSYGEKVVDVMKGFGISAGLPWHLTDEVFVPVNIDDQFHWVLVVVVLKERCLKVYDSMCSSRIKDRKNYSAIEKLAAMLPQYLQRSDFFQQNIRTNWSSLDCYQG